MPATIIPVPAANDRHTPQGKGTVRPIPPEIVTGVAFCTEINAIPKHSIATTVVATIVEPRANQFTIILP
jgi:hypothetical protein